MPEKPNPPTIGVTAAYFGTARHLEKEGVTTCFGMELIGVYGDQTPARIRALIYPSDLVRFVHEFTLSVHQLFPDLPWEDR